MYTSYIGKKLLGIYNERMRVSLSAEDFFEQVFFPLFFNDKKHLMHVANSPFFQKPREEDVKRCGSKSLAQLHNLKKAMEQDVPNMAIYVGYAAKDIKGTTSGQISEMHLSIDANEMYASWIGEALAVGVSGGYAMLIDEPDLLWHLFQGWKFYRKYLDQTPHLKDKQIETWNGHWLHHWCHDYDEQDSMKGFYIDPKSMERFAIPTCAWLDVIMSLARKYRDKTIMAYAYSLSQTNTTLGFIYLYLSEIYSLYDLRDRLILDYEQTILTDKQIETYATFYNFKSACQLGCIGIKALEPDKLRQYYPVGTALYARGKEFQFDTKRISKEYELYKIWIIAMINKKELLDSATVLAKALLEFENTAENGKTVYYNLSKEIRKANKFEIFGDKIKEAMINAPKDQADVFKKVFEDVYYLSRDIFPLFVVLLDFEYNYLKIKE